MCTENASTDRERERERERERGEKVLILSFKTAQPGQIPDIVIPPATKNVPLKRAASLSPSVIVQKYNEKYRNQAFCMSDYSKVITCTSNNYCSHGQKTSRVGRIFCKLRKIRITKIMRRNQGEEE